jgi:cysteine desulfurase/selenocysteine lyase
MTTSDKPPFDPTAASSETLTAEIAQLANAFFATPPNPGPSALGVSPVMNAPPLPGPAHAMPLASTPMPKPADANNIPAAISESVGVQPVVLAGTPSGSSEPYFMQIAGMPTAAPGGTPSAAPAPIPSQSPSPSTSALPPQPAAGSPSPPTERAVTDFSPELVPSIDATPGIFDAHSIKRDFPILRERIHGKPIVWLDNAATTQKPQVVIDRVSWYYEHENSNVHRGAHTLAARATDAYEAARDKVRRFLNAPSVKTIVFVRGATEAINLVAKSWGARNVNEGDEILITHLEHHANIVPWQQLCLEKKCKLRVAPVDDRGQVILEAYERMIGPKTRMVSFTQVSNALGTITPAQEMVDMAHRHGAIVHVDGAQAVSHMPVDVQSLDADFYSFSGHKIFAPTGIGVLYGKQDLLDAMPPWQGGGNMIQDVTFEKTIYQAAPYRFEAGTGSIGDAVGLGAALDYVTALGLPNISRYEHELLEYAESRLVTVPGLTIIGCAPEKAGVMSFVLDGQRTEDVGGMLDQEGIAVRSGHHCAQPILRRFGLESTVRASLAPYNTKEDIDALVDALLRIQTGRV